MATNCPNCHHAHYKILQSFVKTGGEEFQGYYCFVCDDYFLGPVVTKTKQTPLY